MPEITESTATETPRVFYYDPNGKRILTRKGQGEWVVVTDAVVVRVVTQRDDMGDPVVVSALIRDTKGREFIITTNPSGSQAVLATREPGEATPEEAKAKAPEGYRPVQNQSTGRWFYAPDPTKPPDQWKNPNPERYEWVQESVSETNPDTGEPMEAQVRWVLQEKAATPASLQAEIDAALLAGDTKRAHDLYDQKQQLELQSPGFKKSREDKATQERQRQLEWNMNFAATQEEKDWAARQWTAEFGQKQWEASQQAQREALRLGVDISRSPADWWALENLRYGSQANRPYTGAEVAPRTWVDEWLKFAQQPQGTAPPVPRRITPPGFTPTYGEPAPPAETVAKAPAQSGAQAFPQPGYPFAPVPGSEGSPLFATEAEAKAWRVANSGVTRQEDIPDLNAAWGVGGAPGTVATGGGTNNPAFVGADDTFQNTFGTPSAAPTPVPTTELAPGYAWFISPQGKRIPYPASMQAELESLGWTREGATAPPAPAPVAAGGGVGGAGGLAGILPQTITAAQKAVAQQPAAPPPGGPPAPVVPPQHPTTTVPGGLTPTDQGVPSFFEPLAAVPGSQGSPLFATEAEAKAWGQAQPAAAPAPATRLPPLPSALAMTQADIPALNAAWGVKPVQPTAPAPPTPPPAPATDTRIEMQNGEGTTVFALPEEEESLVLEGFIRKKTGTLLDRAAPWLSRGRTGQAGRGVPSFTQPSALPRVPAQARFEAVHPLTKETAIISSNEIPGFNEAGFEIKKQVKLYDFLPYQMPGFGSGLASPLSRLPQQGVRQALFGQPVSRPRNWPTLGAPTMPSAQSWGALPWEGQQIFQSEVERLGVPWQSYSQEMASLWPSWGTPGRFRRAPTRMGTTGG